MPALVSQDITNLQNGVSQQSPALRYRSQCEEQENCRNDPVEGMGKRPNTIRRARVSAITEPELAVLKTYERDENEQYKMVIEDGLIRVFDTLSGIEYPVVSDEQARKYMRIKGDTQANRAYQLLNTIDTTFVLNKTAAVRRLKLGEEPVEASFNVARTLHISTMRHPLSGQRADGFTYEASFTINNTAYKMSDPLASATTLAATVLNGLQEQYGSTATAIRLSGYDIFVDMPASVDLDLSSEWTAYDSIGALLGTGSLITVITYAQNQSTAPVSPPAALWYIKQADYASTYIITIDGASFSITTPEATSDQARAGLNTIGLTSEMAGKINSNGNYSASQHGNTLYIKRANEADFTIEAHDDLGDRASYAVKEYAATMDTVPPNGIEGFKLQIKGEASDISVEPYYIMWTSLSDTGDKTTGVWTETIADAADTTLDPRSMPHALVRLQDNTKITVDNPLGIYFDLGSASYASRSVGDDDTAPFPSFVSAQNSKGMITKRRHIKTMGYHKNRMTLVSDENIVLSETGEYQNFFPTTSVTILDSDPIDIALNINAVAPVEHMLQHEGHLFLFAPRHQMVVTSGQETFSASSIDVKTLSTYKTDTDAAPFIHEGSIHFWDKGAKYSQLYEYIPQGGTGSYKALPLMAHVPRYVTGDVIKSVSIQPANLMVHLTRDDDGKAVNYLYVTNILFEGSERVQNAWQKWTFKGTVIDIALVSNRLSVLMNYEGVLYLEDIILTHDPLKEEIDIPVFLDSRVELDSEDNLDNLGGRTVFAYKGRRWAGHPYIQKYVFSQFFPRDGDGKSITTGILQLRYLTLSYINTTTFEVQVARGLEVRSKMFEGVTVGSLQFMLGSIPTVSGTEKFPIHTRSTRAYISILNATPQDALFHAATWSGAFTQKTQRM
jgi:hypothetical protein